MSEDAPKCAVCGETTSLVQCGTEWYCKNITDCMERAGIKEP